MKHSYKPILTGSMAYGKPTEKSDADLVLFLSEKEADLLKNLADPPTKEDIEKDKQYQINGGGESLRFGKLNIIIVTDEKRYEVWRKGTLQLKKRAKRLKEKAAITRDAAIRHFEKLRKKAGLFKS